MTLPKRANFSPFLILARRRSSILARYLLKIGFELTWLGTWAERFKKLEVEMDLATFCAWVMLSEFSLATTALQRGNHILSWTWSKMNCRRVFVIDVVIVLVPTSVRILLERDVGMKPLIMSSNEKTSYECWMVHKWGMLKICCTIGCSLLKSSSNFCKMVVRRDAVLSMI